MTEQKAVGDANERYEILAEQFYRETGFMAPGKDSTGQEGISKSDTIVRLEVWALWHKHRTEIATLKAENERLRGLCGEAAILLTPDEILCQVQLRGAEFQDARKLYDKLRTAGGDNGKG